jgi:hypothetical protein
MPKRRASDGGDHRPTAKRQRDTDSEEEQDVMIVDGNPEGVPDPDRPMLPYGRNLVSVSFEMLLLIHGKRADACIMLKLGVIFCNATSDSSFQSH